MKLKLFIGIVDSINNFNFRFRRWLNVYLKPFFKKYSWIFWLILPFIFMYFTTGLHTKDLSVSEERYGTTYIINSTLEYGGFGTIYDITNLDWYLNKTEIWFKKDSNGLILDRQEIWLNGRHITILPTKPPDYISANYCLEDTSCFSNVKLDKIAENRSRVGYASNYNFSKKIKFNPGKKNLVVTVLVFPMLIYPSETFTLFKGSELRVYKYVDTSG